MGRQFSWQNHITHPLCQHTEAITSCKRCVSFQPRNTKGQKTHESQHVVLVQLVVAQLP